MREVRAIKQCPYLIGKRNRHRTRPCAEEMNQFITSIPYSNGRLFRCPLQVLRQVVANAHFLDGMELSFQIVHMPVFVLNHALEQNS